MLPAIPFRFLNSSAFVLLGREVSDMSAAVERINREELNSGQEEERERIILTNQVLGGLYEASRLLTKLVLVTDKCSWARP